MLKKALVTGSSGFIGQHLTSYIASQGYQVLGIDKKAPDHWNSKQAFQQCDLLDLDSVRSIFQEFNPNYVFHLAAETALYAARDLQEYASNITGVENLIFAIRENSNVTRCIFTSSQLVCEVGYIPVTDQDYRPTTPYGQSKVLTEQIVRKYDGGGVEWCIVRPTTVWGPGIGPHYQTLFKLIDQGRYFHVGNYPLYKSYSYIGNIVYQYVKLMEAPQESLHRKTFYLADYEPISLRNWINLIQQKMQSKPVPSYPEKLVKILAILGDLITRSGYSKFPFNSFRLKNILTEYIFDLSETEKICGRLPYTMEDGVEEMVDWLKQKKII
jgi:GlcNAc-P-P-Und epimerase